MDQGFFVANDTAVHRLNPLTKLTFAVPVLLIQFIFNRPTATVGIIAVALAVATVGGFARRLLTIVLVLSIPAFILLTFIHGFLHDGDATIHMGSWALTDEAILQILRTTGRVAVLSAVSACIVCSTAPHDFMRALLGAGLSPRLAYAFGATFMFLPLIHARLKSISIAQQARGVDPRRSISARIHATAAVIGPLFAHALNDVPDRTMALESRGFGATTKPTVLRAVPDSRAQRSARFAASIGSAALVLFWVIR